MVDVSLSDLLGIPNISSSGVYGTEMFYEHMDVGQNGRPRGPQMLV